MGGCVSNQLEEGFKVACEKSDLKLFQKVFDDAKASGDALDFFKVFTDEAKQNEYDFISYFFKNIGGRTTNITPFLKIMKEQILSNRSNKDKAFATFSNKFDYFDLLVQKQSPEEGGHKAKALSNEDSAALLDAFRFFLDCRTDNIFPEKSFPNDGNFSPAFTRLCSSDRFTDHIRHMISSGLVDARFKNSNDPKTMKAIDDELQKTPLEAACGNYCVEIVQELIVSNLGGNNFADCVKALMDGELAQLGMNNKLDAKYEEGLDTKATEIFLVIVSQAGAKDQIRDCVYKSWTFAREAKFIGAKKLHAALKSNGCE